MRLAELTDEPMVRKASGFEVLGQRDQASRGNFPILSRDPSFYKTTKNPGEMAGF